MSNTPVTTSANVLVGSARLLVAVLGTALPTVTPATGALTWLPAWKEVGATEKGTDISYTPTIGDIKIDESAAPIGKLLTTEKCIISATLAEATLLNLQRSISASKLTTVVAEADVAGTTVVDVGSGVLTYCMVGLEGIGPGGLPRFIIGYKAMAAAAVKMAFARTTQTNIPIQFELLADTSKPLGEQLYKIVNIDAVATS
jgi:hypothetical protein